MPASSFHGRRQRGPLKRLRRYLWRTGHTTFEAGSVTVAWTDAPSTKASGNKTTRLSRSKCKRRTTLVSRISGTEPTMTRMAGSHSIRAARNYHMNRNDSAIGKHGGTGTTTRDPPGMRRLRRQLTREDSIQRRVSLTLDKKHGSVTGLRQHMQGRFGHRKVTPLGSDPPTRQPTVWWWRRFYNNNPDLVTFWLYLAGGAGLFICSVCIVVFVEEDHFIEFIWIYLILCSLGLGVCTFAIRWYCLRVMLKMSSSGQKLSPAQVDARKLSRTSSRIDSGFGEPQLGSLATISGFPELQIEWSKEEEAQLDESARLWNFDRSSLPMQEECESQM